MKFIMEVNSLAYLQLDDGPLCAHGVLPLADVVAVAGLGDLLDPERGLVNVVVELGHVGVVEAAVVGEDAVAEGPVEARRREGLHPAADVGRLPQVEGDSVKRLD